MKTMRRFNVLALAMTAMVTLLCAVAPLRAFADEQQTVPLIMIVVEYDGVGERTARVDSYAYHAFSFKAQSN